MKPIANIASGAADSAQATSRRRGRRGGRRRGLVATRARRVEAIARDRQQAWGEIPRLTDDLRRLDRDLATLSENNRQAAASDVREARLESWRTVQAATKKLSPDRGPLPRGWA